MEETIKIDEGGIVRIRNAAIRINKVIYLVGSRASGLHNPYSDFDYIIPTIRSKEWQKIKNSLPGAKSIRDNLVKRIDLMKVEIDESKPHVKVTPL
jgi:predicted nucleotidyltransferase